jgi:hypothetical protein
MIRVPRSTFFVDCSHGRRKRRLHQVYKRTQRSSVIHFTVGGGSAPYRIRDFRCVDVGERHYTLISATSYARHTVRYQAGRAPSQLAAIEQTALSPCSGAGYTTTGGARSSRSAFKVIRPRSPGPTPSPKSSPVAAATLAPLHVAENELRTAFVCRVVQSAHTVDRAGI